MIIMLSWRYIGYSKLKTMYKFQRFKIPISSRYAFKLFSFQSFHDSRVYVLTHEHIVHYLNVDRKMIDVGGGDELL